MAEKEILEKFILNNRDLEKLESQLAQFNIFETLNIASAEIRHSYMLAWLLNPNENHGCGDYFAKLFLKYIFSINRPYLRSNLTIFDLENFDYRDLEIRREWKNIDILIISEKNKFVVTIENKIGSVEHSNQLRRYFEIVSREFSDHEKIFVYLTPEGEQGSDENWLFFDYSTILSIIRDLIEFKKSSISETVATFIEHYCTIIRRYVVSNSEVERICRVIYKKHTEALDIIFQYKPDVEYDVSQIVQEYVKAAPELILDTARKTMVRFTTKKLDRLVPKNGTGEWTSSRRLLLFEFINRDKRLVLRLIIGPGHEDARKNLHDFAKQNYTLFNKSKRQLNVKWFTIYQSEYLKKSDFEDLDLAKIKQKLAKRIDTFLQGDLKKIETHFIDNWKNK